MDERLSRLAALYGIEPGYHDIWGQWRTTSEDTLRALLAALGVDAHDPQAVEDTLADDERESWSRVVPPITVLRARELARGMRIHLQHASLARNLAWRITSESGEIREQPFGAVRLAVLEDYQKGSLAVRALELPLPPDLSEGYHRVTLIEGDTLLGSGLVAVVPERCYLPPALADGARVWGAAVQLYGVRSSRNAGIGNFGDLRACAEVWGARGAGIVGTNPLHALSLRNPGNASPYSPSSRLFLNPLYIDVEAVPDFAELAHAERGLAARWRKQSEALRNSAQVDYAGVAQCVRGMFDALYENFRARHLASVTPRARAFAQFRESRGGQLRRHALHEALAEFHGKAWRDWPEDFRDPDAAGVRAFAEAHPEKVGLHEYLQWIADLQLGAAQARTRELGMAVGLYVDLAISIAPDGSEAWANQRLYVLGAHVGAPPDEFNRTGQDWGLPPLAPRRLREAAYGPLIATLRANMVRAGALRIDHVMGLARLWWVPAGMKAGQGAYVRYPLDDLLGIVALESHRNRCLVIGEDLGTVSDDLRKRLAEAELLSYRLLLFERDGPRFKAPAEYPQRALVAWSTHDLPTFTGWWQDEDLRTRAALKHFDDAGLAQQRMERAGSRRALIEALAREELVAPDTSDHGPATDGLRDAVQTFLARTAASVMVVQMEDVLGVREQANLPGTIEEHPNWRRKLPVPIEAWGRDERLRRLARLLAEARGGRRNRREVPARIRQARIPRATYRLQLHGEFTFRDATGLVAYLAALGVSHVYCSPFLRARPGSKHGYDIIDHDELNPEIGTREEFDAFVAELKRHDLALVMDIVPNHMGVLGADNEWWQDLLENGPASTLADFFDIDWRPPSEHLANRVLLPILGDHYGVELAGGKLQLAFDTVTGTFAVRYFEHRLPIDPQQYPRTLAPAVRALEASGPELAHQAQALRSLMEGFARLPRRDETERARMDERNLNKEVSKGRLALLARVNHGVADAIHKAVATLNGRADDPASFDELHDLLERQPYRLAYWRVAQDEINYRRFFDINDLAALRQENRAVFDVTHRMVMKLVKEGSVEALRIDHPDGLYDPRAYFQRLQEACGKPTYVVVEKIVASFENLPEDWAVHGTTGYRFANVVNGLFVDSTAQARLTRTYNAFIANESGFAEIALRSKRLILRSALASELTVLTSRLARIARADRTTRDFTFTTLREGLADVIASFPVYRTYIDDHVGAEDRRYIDWAIQRARSESRAADVSVFDFLRDVLACELPTRSPALAAQLRQFARKFQQLTSPVMAKGVEDTSFYVYNRLVSLNDVGGDPDEFGFPTARFHRASSHRARHWPHTMLATSTHDNKRSEDVRARIDVISERVPEWRLQLRKWHRMNSALKTEVDGHQAPSRNDEYLLYQTLLGSYPVEDAASLEAYTGRIVAYMQKATREAKQRTSWANVNEAYEAATTSFVHALLQDRPGNAFLDDFRAAVLPVAWVGLLNSLSMITVKLTSPGVPDTYQGNEVWDFSLVDPDNRRPVDYERRRAMLAGIEALRAPLEGALASMLENHADGRAKLYVLWRLLQLRKAHEQLFLKGGYTAVRTTGLHARRLIAFARRHGGESAVTVAPRLIAGLGVIPGQLPCGEALWRDTRVDLPFFKDGTVLRDVLSGREHRLERGGIGAGELLATFPTAVLTLQ
ncbi:MAG: malto-oligosyltrehalose synthase [Pseudomonadota bacterium]|nr:malto-oligosyltrehalose synthase [Pseudomonadota bacterium]